MFRSHSNAIRPFVTVANKYSRMKYAIGMVGSDMQLNDMLQYVHLVEKWFYLTNETRKYYLVPGEKKPRRTSKWFITQVMFLSAVVRPGASRVAGTMETKSIIVTKDVYRAFLVEKFLPSIVAVWPHSSSAIKLQHDNARAHVTSSDAELTSLFGEFKAIWWDFELALQALNSPDTNIFN
ncbi:hypothetical protein H257_13179 [Aphanomyces astaci]|uniref:Tc1-like transposase DDE domain-containing protein n=1 Tax=Aphanomyces astaci TaxID=112090 RepID=W4FX34_APHAT|nr:hypothetical protein H257_13179 [Aphanomyces astaci]ETV71516.1 hypothetical protein H257_13179 [Aphanomyces astaci]|eukprot:XP_009838949.1 hypothetical protein H257_13179 [Aphanomyces astaci]